MNVPRTEFDTSNEEGPRLDVLPLELDDGTRITCTSIAGGQRSTDGVPDFLYLQIGKDGDEGTLERYVSSVSLQKSLGVQTGDLDHVRGLISLACLEYDNGIASMTPERRTALERVRVRIEHIIGRSSGEPTDPVPPAPRPLIDRARERLDHVVEQLVAVDQNSPDELQFLASYVQAHEVSRASSPGRMLMQSMAAGAGGFLGQIAARRERHDDEAPPERSSMRARKRRATPKSKKQPKRKR